MLELFLWKLKKRTNFFLLIVALALTQTSKADMKVGIGSEQQRQQITVAGIVIDEEGEPMPGVSVVVKGTTTGMVTNMDGGFNISVPNENAVLTFSFLGYATQEQTVGSRRNLRVVLLEESRLIDEVVVVGYGTQKKATLTGSVVAINNEQLTLTKNANTQNMLTGKLPGLRVIQKTSEPGQFTNQFDIRGLGSPLFIVDGVPRGDFPRMDGTEIESISILKDASAAIYGVRAANGVVLITTKNGKKQKSSIEYSGYYGIQTPAEILKPINAWDRALLFNETKMRDTTDPTKVYDDQYFQDLKDGKMPDTNWYEQIMRNTAPQQQHNVSIQGGNNDVDYYINLGYNNQGSFWKTNSTNYERYNLRTNVNVHIVDNLKASVRLNYIMDETQSQYYDSWTIFAKLWRSKPTDPVYANNTAPYYFHPTSGDIENVVPLIDTDLSGEKSYKKNILQSNLQLNYQVPFIKGLSTNFMFSYDKNFNDDSSFKKAFDEYTYNAVNDSYTPYTRNATTQLTRNYYTGYSKLWNVSLNYENTFSAHHRVNALLLYEESYGQSYSFNASRYFSIPIPYLFAGDSENQVGNDSGLSESANKALVGRVNYEYRGKYLVEAAFRQDGSSKFPKGKQWGFFPSVQLGYRISEEPFIKNNLSFVDNLKIRGTWGQLGDDAASQFQFIEGFDYPASGGNRNRASGYVFGNTFVNALGFRNAPNYDITWYTSTMKNVGLDVDVWSGLFGFSVDLFQRDRDGLLDTPAIIVPGTFGSGISDANLNSDRTKGFEMEVRHHNRISDIHYNVTGFVSMTRSMLTKKVQPERTNSYDYWRNNLVDRYNDIWFGKAAAGSYQSYDEIANSIYSNNGTLPGDPIYVDWNEDGVIDDNDNHPIATTIDPDKSFQDQRNYPLMNFGLTLSAQYKWFDLTLQLQGSAMSYVSYGEQLLEPLAWDGNALPILFDRWHPADPDVDPYEPSIEWISGRYPYGKTRAEVNSEFNIQNGAYVRLKNTELGFTLPQNMVTRKLKVSNIRLFVNTYNLFTLTGVEGLDPERPTELYGYMYPLNRTFNFGGTIRF